MASPYGPMRMIVNPQAGRGAIGRALPRIKEVVEQEELEYDIVETNTPGHAKELARAAVQSGIMFVVAVGGDGTVHEVVNGLMGDDGPLVPDVVLGVVPSGSGSDFIKTFGLPTVPEEAARNLAGKNVWGALDIPRIRYRGKDGKEESRWFANIAEAGIGAHVVVSAAKMPRRLGGRAYRLAALRAIIAFRPQAAHLEFNGRKGRGVRPDTPLEPGKHSGVVTMVVIANCQFYGGGLRVAPRAIPSDGMLDVLVGEGTKRDALRALRKMPMGEHVPSKIFTEYLVDTLALDGPEPMLIEADGEPLGTTPAHFDLVRGAIRLKV
ncbi:MAG TPA: diacylglycerol kinase family protein [Actinomycetota bacterium]|nr:diacylglycerol kinase family protein [Actinomycetota bacterium]